MRPIRSRAATLAAALALLLLGSACSTGDDAPSGGTASATPSAGGSPGTDAATTTHRRYVALGDSFSAGPLIPTSDLAGGCLRSDHNYPSLLAQRLEIEDFVDVTCSAATTRDLSHVQRTFGDARIPPQLRSVTAKTDLVTVGIGGNDLDLFTTLISTCTRLRGQDPAGSPCTTELSTRGPDLTTATRVIRTRVAGVLRAIRARAPQAEVLLVGYPRLVPEQGTCARLPLATGDYAEGRRITRTLDRALQQAAARTSATYVDMYEVSRGHDICAKDPWVNGRATKRSRALAYHPFLAGMRGDAREVLRVLEQG